MNIENPYHNKVALYKKKLGYIQYWGWNNSYLFLDIELGVKRVIKEEVLKAGRSAKIISRERFLLLHKERNYPTSSFNNKIHNGNTIDNLSERQKKYGVIYDSQIKCMFEMGTNGYWSDIFCTNMARFITNVQLYRDVEKLFGGIQKALSRPNRIKYNNMVINYHEGKNSMYTKNCKVLGLCNDDPSITEDDIREYVREAFAMKEEYKKKIFSGPQNRTQEMKYYLNPSS